MTTRWQRSAGAVAVLAVFDDHALNACGIDPAPDVDPELAATLWLNAGLPERRREPRRRPSLSDDAESPQEEQGQQDRKRQRGEAAQPIREEEEHPRWMPRRPRPTPDVSSVSRLDRRNPRVPATHAWWVGSGRYQDEVPDARRR